MSRYIENYMRAFLRLHVDSQREEMVDWLLSAYPKFTRSGAERCVEVYLETQAFLRDAELSAALSPHHTQGRSRPSISNRGS
jgi:hypothetical protein